ncbi:RAMP superfamily CRISPR-associated protein [Pseudoleptotrichia goodfellowii]|jgi:CRISPR-associated RAMP protein, csm3 family|uniref:CRISPR-associated RAMP protein n=2 Tax=Pseudoleptotrichia goodfellowii TaxID=157692 RepID=D0GMM5_9FUSO|nr:RAMP superfamily CRISPR-associated protein [Pseudoleptotrichia goodfellowii]EEY34655.1 CRISPR-associated RAMP protein [Pseudoleptotrichia goodfellowii F0264]BBM36942.1 CRISPR-associated RAMP protein [Pseudoleptotrichia goodfellowii]
MRKIKVKIETKSNCLIGNHTQSFSIGGVDQCTTVDNDGKPLIQASAFKGSTRFIVKSEGSDMEETKKFYKNYLEDLLKKYEKRKLENNLNSQNLEEIINKIKECINDLKPEYLFGIEGINTTPRLYFSDLKVVDGRKNTEEYFIIDSKTAILEDGDEVVSNPRTYKAIRPGVKFEGEIILRDFKNFVDIKKIAAELVEKLELFNDGYYRMGNSKSRGYGKISIETEIVE